MSFLPGRLLRLLLLFPDGSGLEGEWVLRASCRVGYFCRGGC